MQKNSLLSSLVCGLLLQTSPQIVAQIELMNPDMEEASANVPAGWEGKFGQLEVKRDTEVFHQGKASLNVDRSQFTDKSGVAHQMLDVKPGMKLKVGGWVKTEGTAKVNFAVHFFNEKFTWEEFSLITHLEGTNDWQLGEKEVEVPEQAVRMAIGLYVDGQGKGWLDDVSVSGQNVEVVIKKPVPDPEKPVEPSDAKLIPTTAIPGYFSSYPKGWMAFHEANLRRTKQGDIGLLFLGDSITQGWNQAPEVFQQSFGFYKPANYGIGGDQTSNVLWRLDHGEVDNISPSVVVLMIGVNNLWSRKNSPDEIAGGIKAVVEKLRAKLPQSKVLLLGILPITETPEHEDRGRIIAINQQIAKLDDGSQVKFLDLGAKFLDANGRISREVMGDFLHPTKKGYEILASELVPVIDAFMKKH